MASELPFISVVIPTYNRPDELAACLAAISTQDYAGSFEVIVVDDGSSVDLLPVVEACDCNRVVSLIKQANAGPGAARNHGARVSRGELLAFTDDDCLPESDWLTELAGHYQQYPQVLIGGYTATPRGENIYSDTAQFILDCAYHFYNGDPHDSRFHASNNMALSREEFLAVCGFDESFHVASEDREFCSRWRLERGRIHELNRARVIHAKALNFRDFIGQFFRYGQGAWRYRKFRHRWGGDELAGNEPHSAFLASVIRDWSGLEDAPKFRMLMLLGTWQVSNLAGFLYAAASSQAEATDFSDD
jgi:glycosyltransferase involved in cell wall biosynthesis